MVARVVRRARELGGESENTAVASGTSGLRVQRLLRQMLDTRWMMRLGSRSNRRFATRSRSVAGFNGRGGSIECDIA